MKKQVQRFRVYAFDDENRVIGEVTGDGITWGVHLANTRARVVRVQQPAR